MGRVSCFSLKGYLWSLHNNASYQHRSDKKQNIKTTHLTNLTNNNNNLANLGYLSLIASFVKLSILVWQKIACKQETNDRFFQRITNIFCMKIKSYHKRIQGTILNKPWQIFQKSDHAQLFHNLYFSPEKVGRLTKIKECGCNMMSYKY